MHQLPSFVDPILPEHVCRLKKAICGLKQARRSWFHRFSGFILTHGFHCSQVDLAIFLLRSSSHIIILIL